MSCSLVLACTKSKRLDRHSGLFDGINLDTGCEIVEVIFPNQFEKLFVHDGGSRTGVTTATRDRFFKNRETELMIR